MQKFTKGIVAIMLTVATLVFAAGCKPENGDNDVRVTTYTPQDITQNSAVCGGDVIVTQGLSLSSLGVCWSTERNPTVEDAHLSTTNWNEPYVCTITGLELGTKYHVRAYALRGLEYYYGDDKTFTTEGNSGSGGHANGHAYVDLGLPSGTLWATCNVGANTPEGYGNYYAWGETTTKLTYNWSNYRYCNGSYNTLTKYCSSSSYGNNGFTDNLTTLQFSDDAARANWGSDWRIPTRAEWKELENNTTVTWTTQNGVCGRKFTASNGNSLFLPAAGYRDDSSLYLDGACGRYWSSLCTGDRYAWYLNFNSGLCFMGYDDRDYGQSVRAVLHASKN